MALSPIRFLMVVTALRRTRRLQSAAEKQLPDAWIGEDTIRLVDQHQLGLENPYGQNPSVCNFRNNVTLRQRNYAPRFDQLSLTLARAEI
jgi:hypothetical protein